MVTFPTLSREPRGSEYKEAVAEDTTIRSKSEAGYTQTRARFTRLTYTISVVYDGLTRIEKNLVKAFETTAGIGGESFLWVDPEGMTRTVRLADVITYTPWEDTGYMYWKVEMSLEEV